MTQIVVETLEETPVESVFPTWQVNLGHHGRGDRKAQKKRYAAKYRERKNAKKRARRAERRLTDSEWVAKERARGIHRYQIQKARIMTVISGSDPPQCSHCGCNDLRFLEFNHKTPNFRNPDKPHGLKARTDRNRNLVHRILAGKLTGEEFGNLEVVCRVCNAWDYLEKKYGDTRHKVLWTKPDEQPKEAEGILLIGR